MSSNAFGQIKRGIKKFISWLSQQPGDLTDKLSMEDHRRLLKMLDVRSLRPPVSPDQGSPHSANIDEANASPYSSIPDPLTFDDHSTVDTPAQWELRRQEIQEHFDREVYGRVPQFVPAVSWEIVSHQPSTIGQQPAKIKTLIGRVDNAGYPEIKVEIEVELGTPQLGSDPVPVIMELSPSLSGPSQEEFSWREQVLAKGWGYCTLLATSVQADNGAGLRQGIIGLVNKGNPRKADEWGALRAWAWGASRVIDYLESDPDADAKRVGIAGLSRFGKAAIVALAYEARFCVGLIGSSGAGGAKILRRMYGEQLENLASPSAYHWFTPNFVRYAGPLTPNDLPVDAHHLIALCAPRPVFISSGSPLVEGPWTDAKGMFLSGVYAGPVYEMLGKKGLGTSSYGSEEMSLTDGDIAFRQHSGGHTLSPNWPAFIHFAERYFIG